MNIKQVAEWLMEAGITYELLAIKGDQSEINQRRSAQFKDRAAQVEAMTCDGCKYWSDINRNNIGSRLCNNKLGKREYAKDSFQTGYSTFGPKFGCIHWEEKK